MSFQCPRSFIHLTFKNIYNSILDIHLRIPIITLNPIRQRNLLSVKHKNINLLNISIAIKFFCFLTYMKILDLFSVKSYRFP